MWDLQTKSGCKAYMYDHDYVNHARGELVRKGGEGKNGAEGQFAPAKTVFRNSLRRGAIGWLLLPYALNP